MIYSRPVRPTGGLSVCRPRKVISSRDETKHTCQISVKFSSKWSKINPTVCYFKTCRCKIRSELWTLAPSGYAYSTTFARSSGNVPSHQLPVIEVYHWSRSIALTQLLINLIYEMTNWLNLVSTRLKNKIKKIESTLCVICHVHVCALLGLGLDSFADHEDKKYDLKKILL
jgi:hypothetical protein